nr:hypothetical protein [uncultured Pseudomonas sp.]
MQFPESLKSLGLIVSGFTAGIAAFQSILTIAGLEVGPRHSSCPNGQVALRVESYPFGAKVDINELDKPFYNGMCLNQGRYGVTVRADRYQEEHRVVQLGASDQISLFSLKPKIIVHLDKENLIQDRKFTGEAITIRLMDIDVRSAVQLIADFAGKNFVVSNNVEGTISLALENIPWDLALDSILISTGNQLEERNGLFYVSKKY